MFARPDGGTDGMYREPPSITFRSEKTTITVSEYSKLWCNRVGGGGLAGQSRLSLSVDESNNAFRLRAGIIEGNENPLGTVENFTNALIHESDHIMVNLGNINIQGAQKELRAITLQRRHATWRNTSNRFKQDLYQYYLKQMKDLNDNNPLDFNGFSQ